MEELACVRCMSSKFRNPNLVFNFNICGHSMCANCIEVAFIKGSGPCPKCLTPLRRNAFKLQQFEDATVDVEVEIRKRILRDFNKTEEDFETLDKYNDYLEMVEDIIFNLVKNTNVNDTRERIEQYKKENKDIIIRNRMKLKREEQALDELIEEEKLHTQYKRDELLRDETEQRNKKLRVDAELIDNLAHSNSNVKDIISSYVNKKEEIPIVSKPLSVPKSINFTNFSTGIKFNQSSIPIQIKEGPLYKYEPYSIQLYGPPCPEITQLDSLGYLKYIRNGTVSEQAGGFLIKTSCLHYIQECVSSLFERKSGN
ncbi:CDK-activating kinase assembly factor MAT1 [Daktulosphaira vitifoliae]|uniref:CDK-activating kinase assembly factor MAT1 n=1 Tax=Daktulosphaira vitifoliae TaxID=58002 RepID=UPI0021AAC9A6|nr:CDK-activating kinase assembly factor MAT1 [Daktulosphaira vitifoliae]